MPELITLPRTLVSQLFSLVQGSPTQEVCGLVGGRAGVPLRCYPVANVSEDAERRFDMDPAEQIRAMRKMRERGEDLVAIYHSHPSGSCQPSPIDIAQAAYPEALYLIISLGTRGVLEMRGFRMDGSGMREIELETGN
jgi:proteasome lid subunit RPN8/RPN11